MSIRTGLTSIQRSLTELRNMVVGVCGNPVGLRADTWYTHHSFGRVVELLAQRVGHVRYYAPQLADPYSPYGDHRLASDRVTVCPWPAWGNSFRAMTRPDRLIAQYRNMVRECDALLFRGSPPLLWSAHLAAWRLRKPVVHWIVGDPVAVMRGARRGYGAVGRRLSIFFARFEQCMTRRAASISGAHLVANGAELSRIFRSERTIQVVSTSIREGDFLVRDDTSIREPVRLLFVGFIRPEKGIEYLLRAVPMISAKRSVHLAIVGSSEQFSAEHDRLSRLVHQLGLSDCVTWEGYASFGTELFNQMDRSDILVLPSLSEGTPRVLVEARARSLPIVSTNVGGIPSSVSDGEDGLLVAPRDPASLAAAISRLMEDDDLRRSLIRRGRERVKDWTVERFVDLVAGLLADPSGAFLDATGGMTDNR